MRRALQVVAILCTLVVGAASLALIVSQTAWFKDWLRGFIVRQADDYVNGRLTIGRLDGNLFFGVELEDIDVTLNGQSVVSVKDVGPRLQRARFPRRRRGARLHPPEPAGRAPREERRWLEPRAAAEEAAEGSRPRRSGTADCHRRDRHHRRTFVVDGARGHVRRGHPVTHRASECDASGSSTTR